MSFLNKEYFSDFNSKVSKNKLPGNKIFQYIQDIDKEKFNVLLNLLNTSHNHFYWSYPSSNFSFCGLEEVMEFTNQFNDPNFSVNDYYNIERNKVVFDEASIPLFIGGNKFPTEERSNLWNDFKSNYWFLPRILLFNNNSNCYLIINFIEKDIIDDNFIDHIENILQKIESSPVVNNAELSIIDSTSFNDWKESVNKSLEIINNGDISKIVIARILTADISIQTSLEFIIKSLEEQYPGCYTFSYKQNNALFLGATPEKLLNFNNSIIETEALAGSIKRGKDFWEDEILSSQLINNTKDFNEHKSVLNFITNILSEYCDVINYEKEPLIKKLKNILHIWTPIRAELNKDKSIFPMIAKLYPTPAVCGYPQNTAISLIKNLENFDRGMYAGLIGWFNDKCGEFAVALRSALIKENKLYAFAGCGIVNGSTAENEFKETELKFKPILSLFENETISQS